MSPPVFQPWRTRKSPCITHLAFFPGAGFTHEFCHRPIGITEKTRPLGKALAKFSFDGEIAGDDIICEDIVLLWTEARRIITGADLLGQLLRGIAARDTS